MSIVGIDFDGSIRTYDGKPIANTISIIKSHLKKKDKVIIITRRSYFDDHNGMTGEQLEKWVKETLSPDITVIYTNGLYKWRYLINNKVDIFYDDDPVEIEMAQWHSIQTFLIDDDKSSKRKESIGGVVPECFYKSLLLYDSGGLFVHAAERLSYEYSRVMYFCDFHNMAFPESYRKNLGQGIIGIERLNNFEDGKDITDVIFFPDCQQGALQEDLKAHGYRTFGLGKSTELENDRLLFKSWLKNNSLPIIPFTEYNGIDSAIEAMDKLNLHDNPKYFKMSETRGDSETYRADNNYNTHDYLSDLKNRMGYNGSVSRFIVEDELKGLENGIDTYCIDGKLPENIMTGWELKGRAYVSRMIKSDELPSGMQDINNALCKYFGENNCNGFFSTENRYADGKFYFSDTTCRHGVPPCEMQFSNWLNYGDIIWHGSDNELIEPIYRYEYAVQMILASPDSEYRTLNITFDERFKSLIHFYSYYIQDGQYYTVPMHIKGYDVVCSVVGLGSTLEEAEENCMTVAKSINTDGLSVDKYVFNEIEEYLSEADEQGINLF